ncbi:MAG: DUF2007 domain-containing protein [Chitinophagaceae bacterium]|nr:DUF2007 domain-containing protein [Chitinophagaceae bacterium]
MRFIRIRAYDNYIPAHIDMGRLRSEGIECFLADENTVTIDPFLTYAVGGIKLMVPEQELEKALQIFANTQPGSEPNQNA